MRLRRLCEKKRSGKCHVSDAVREDFIAGGEKRELLEVALLEVLQSTGLDRTAQKKIRLQFAARVLNVKERMQEREKEVTGQWLTAERMRTQLTYNEATVKQITSYCSKFPALLTRCGAVGSDCSAPRYI
ncbi:unnamed protein product [Effrenium voratum]|nr:unnamed protein product [Effrenium voratum]